MLDFKKVGEVLPSRRDLLKFGGAGLLGASANAIWPGKVAAAENSQKPRGTAKNVIFVEISGAISHVDTFDFKENIATRKDFDVQKMSNGIYLPNALFPRFQKVLDKVAIMRSFLSHEEVHLNGEYYLQAGRPLNVAFAREIPSVGTVVSYELEKQRRETDTFPTYIAFNLEANQLGAMSTGFLPPKYSVFDLNPEQAAKGLSLDQKAAELLEERYRLLTQLRSTQRSRMSSYGRTMGAFEDFSETGKKLLTDSRWPAVFKTTEQDKARYGNTTFGQSCLFSRNLLQQDGGTHYIHICHMGWDHHKQIWDRSIPDNHYKLISEFDPAAASLIEDLAITPSKSNPNKTLLDETLVVLMSEFGRTVGALNHMAGRDHHKYAFPAMFAGAGVKGGLVLGATDADGARVVNPGWQHKVQPRIENVIATMYSTLGIDWGKQFNDTPSKRTYRYVDPFSAEIIPVDELTPLFG